MEKNDFSVHSGLKQQIILGGGLFIRESVSDRECHASFINTIPLSEVSSEHGEPLSASQDSTEQHQHTV